MTDAPARLLLIEDSDSDARLIQLLLNEARPEAYEVSRVDRLSDASRALASGVFTAVLLDPGLPDSSGLDSVRAILPHCGSAPLIVLSGLAAEDIGLAAVAAGAQDFLVKGRIDGELLARTIVHAVQRRRMEQELRESEQRFRTLAESAPMGIYLADAECNVTWVNPAMCQMLGVPAEMITGTGWISLVHPEDLQGVLADRAKAYASPSGAFRGAFRFLRPDGRSVFVHAISTPSRSADGTIICRVGTMLDLTTERESQEALRQSESRFRLAVTASGIHFFAQDADLRYTWLVRGNMPGDPSCYIGRKDHDFIAPADADRLTAIKKRILATGERIRTEMDIRIFGAPMSVDVTYEPIRDVSGRVIGLVGAAVDITERRRTEAELRRAAEQLQQAHKLEALGTLAGGVAHDFGNLLSAISAHVALARAHGPLPAATLESLNAVEEAARQASGVARSLLTLARGDTAPRAPVRLASVVENIERLMRRTLPRNIVMLVDLVSEHEAWVMGDETQLSQVLLNLMLNARDAMPEGGILRVCLRTSDGQCVDCDDAPRPCAGIVVEDSGIGMPPEVLERACDPFFSTKSPGKGSGLGLAVARAIVQAHGGVLSLRSAPGQGTRVHVSLPAIAAPEPVTTPASSERQRRTAVIVDDNRLTRGLVSSMLVGLGFDVAPPETDICAAALAPDLLVLKTGAAVPSRETASIIRRIKPRGTLLLVPRGAVRTELASSATATLSMPFQQADLAACIDGLLQSRPEDSRPEQPDQVSEVTS